MLILDLVMNKFLKKSIFLMRFLILNKISHCSELNLSIKLKSGLII